MGIRKTSLAIDDTLAGQAAIVLGTRSLRETVQRALEEVVARDLQLRHLERLERGEFELLDPQVMAEAWR